MSASELAIAAEYERDLSNWSQRIVLESTRDAAFYAELVGAERLDFRSFARVRTASYRSDPPDERRLTFIAGGRPVREKGFAELCREFARVRTWASARNIEVQLSILCREQRADKGAEYIAEIEDSIARHGLEDVVTIELKVSLDLLRRRIAASSGVIVPSLYDPYGLMATYAVEVGRPAFVSTHAGVLENLATSDFSFDPLREGDLAQVIANWYEKRPLFRFESRFPSYETLYLGAAAGGPWA
jgi:hypothetical protein